MEKELRIIISGGGTGGHIFPAVSIANAIIELRPDAKILFVGAGSISEFCLLHKPVVLVPSPNVAEDHQTKNALALVDKQAAIYVKDSEAEAKLMDVALNTVADDRKLKELSENIAKLALPDSARIIAQEVIKLAEAEN